MDQTPAGMALRAGELPDLVVTQADRRLLRDLAAQVADLAARPIESEKRDLWYSHNALQAVRPLVFCDPENGWNEIVRPADLGCSGDLARQWEMRLRKEVFWGTRMRDDRVIEPIFPLQYVHSETDWGIHETKIGGVDGGSYTWDAPIKDYSLDLPRLRFPEITVDREATEKVRALAEETLGDLLEVRIRPSWWWTMGMTWTLVNLRGLNQMMLDMLDNPRDLHRVMAFLRDGTMARLDFLEANALLALNDDGTYVGSGGFGWSRELPQPDYAGQARTKDMWGFAESQETVGVSPAMFAEFVFPYQLPLLERFGLNCYGCCEPLDRRWEIVSTIPRLRRVSVSAWASVEGMAERLGRDHVFSWKPRPADLASPVFDEKAIRQYVREMLIATRNCRVEVIMKDNHTIANDPGRVVRWVEIVREEIDRL